MEPYTERNSLLSPGRIGQARWSAALSERIRGFEANQISNLYHLSARLIGVNPDLALAQACEETGWFTSRRWLEQNNPCGLGITSDDVPGHVFSSPEQGIIAHVDHICCYAHTAQSCPVPHEITPDFRHSFHDGNPALSHLQDDTRKWATKPGYVGRILAIANRLLPEETPSMTDWRAVTSRMIADLGARGVDVHDYRGKLGRYTGRNTGKVIAAHWTGDNFGKPIPATNSLADDAKLAEFYRWYHMEGGHGWPGIAYAALAFPSGRVFVCHDLDRLTYHAFNANDDAVGISCPVSNWAQPTSQQLHGLHHVLDWLCFDCPELTAGQGDVWGHKELGFLDARNTATACPGTLLPHIQAYRARGGRFHATTTATAPPADPGFPNALTPDGGLVLNGQTPPDPGVSESVVAIEATTKNKQGEFYAVKWEGHQWGPWRRVG